VFIIGMLAVVCFAVSYRKVAADRCIDNADTSRYNPVRAVCPVMKPQGLSIEVNGGDYIVMNTNVVFQLTQEEVTVAKV
jgi:hypothetical protein